ncbi:MAG: RidA family protein [Bacillati bacterium ANGP1]|uniref:RidA family protein n=1 Tax=Candidatus Segetimicrobium genomatis TaxID=2569760 RepID=A0A537LI33_9BACT|nr:MAG: RidA family protein [Terrabacteria group bacterium ANGP1]
MRREDVAVRGMHKTTGYSHAAKVGGLVFVAGQIAQDVEGALVGRGDIEAQAVQVFDNLKAVLASAGATLDDVVKLTTYTTSLAYRPKIAEVRARYFKTYFPPNTFVVVASLATPEYLLEIEAVAAVP